MVEAKSKRNFPFALSLLLFFFLLATISFAAPDQALLARAKQLQEYLLQDLQTLVNIDSPSGYGAGSEKIMMVLSEKLRTLGGKVEILAVPKGAGYNLIATFPGTGKGRILLMAHSDTVFNVGTVAERPFRIANGKAYGPGVADDKGGIVASLYAVKLLQERGFKNYGLITFLINCDEEIGSPSSRDLIKNLAREHDYVICLEGGRQNDGVVNWRKGTGRMVVEVKGRASHAGSAPESGVNALLELAHQVLQLKKLEDKEKKTTLNFTVFQSGDKLNVIPDYAVARADMRALYPEEFGRVEKSGLEIIKNKLYPESEVKFTLSIGRPAFPPNDKTEALIAKAKSIYQEIGRSLKVIGSGGASDGNYTVWMGTATIDSMGLVGGKGHTADEYIDIDKIPPRLYLLTRMLMELGAQK
jgi:glutamate carboxypeptidase